MINTANIRSNVLSTPAKIEVASLLYGQTVASKLQAEAQANRPWTDRTSQARQRLRGYVSHNGHKVEINLAHGVDYGEELEFAKEKRFAIIGPTLKKESGDIISSWFGMVNKL